MAKKKSSNKITSSRRVPSTAVRDEVLREAGYKCANPTCRNILTLQLHHITWVKDEGDNSATNLIALCGHCHDLHTRGHIPASAIRHWKGLIHALNHAFNKESMDLLLYLNQSDMEKVWYSGDGLLRFAGLIAAELVEVAESVLCQHFKYGTYPQILSTAVRVHLTDKGRQLVDSWLTGNEEEYKALLNVDRSK